MGERASTPPNYRLYAIGDIHGRLDLLTRLLARIEKDAASYPDKKKRLIFLGDYVDRGVESKQVLDRLTDAFVEGLDPVFLRGNHDDLFLSFLKGDLSVAPTWLQLGGSATLASYGLNPFGAINPSKLPSLREALLKVLPPAHPVFLKETLFAVTYGDYYFVHAGVRPGVPLNRQKAEDQMWIRGDFIFYPKGMGKMIIHGHTIHTEPDVKPNRIGIDTGAFATGKLTCLVLDGTTRAFLST